MDRDFIFIFFIVYYYKFIIFCSYCRAVFAVPFLFFVILFWLVRPAVKVVNDWGGESCKGGLTSSSLVFLFICLCHFPL